MRKEKEQPGIMLYWEVFDMLKALPDQEVKPLLLAMADFSRFGEEPVLEGTLPVIWPLLRQKMEADRERYQKVRNRNQINCYIGNFKRFYAPKHGVSPEDPEALEEYLLQMGMTEEEAHSHAVAYFGAPDTPTATAASTAASPATATTEATAPSKTKSKTKTKASAAPESMGGAVFAPSGPVDPPLRTVDQWREIMRDMDS